MGFERGPAPESRPEYDWQVGDIAMVTTTHEAGSWLAMKGESGWVVSLDAHVRYRESTSARPLLVADAQNIGQMKDLISALRKHGYEPNLDGLGPKANIAKAVASLLKQPLPPPPPPPQLAKPTEPAGLGAVVTDACGAHYVRVENGVEKYTRWRRQAHGGLYAWDEIDVPDADHVLSEGLNVEATS